jgi:hypothetical protein
VSVSINFPVKNPFRIKPPFMRKRSRADGPQLKCIRVRFGDEAIDFVLTAKSDLPQRRYAFAQATSLHARLKSMIRFHPRPAQSVNTKENVPETPPKKVCWEDLELPDSFDFAEATGESFEFASFHSSQHP